MGMLQRFVGATTMGPAQSNRTVTHVAVPLGDSLPFINVVGDGTISNCWDTYVSMSRLSETQTRFERAGNGGTININFGYVRDSRLTTRYFGQITGLVGGSNVIPIGATQDLNKAWIVPMGMSASGDRDDETGVKLTFADPDNVDATITTAAAGQELGFAVCSFEGLVGNVQAWASASNTALNVALGSAVIPAQTAIWQTARTTTAGAWNSQDVDTIDLLDANNVRIFRYQSGAGSVSDRAGFVVPFPADIRVQHPRRTVANGVAVGATALSMVNQDRAIIVPNGACNHSDFATNVAGRVLSESEYQGSISSPVNANFTRANATNESTVAMQVIEWLAQPFVGAFMGNWV